MCFTAAGNLPLLVEAAESDILKETEMAEAALQRDVVNDATFDVDVIGVRVAAAELVNVSSSSSLATSAVASSVTTRQRDADIIRRRRDDRRRRYCVGGFAAER